MNQATEPEISVITVSDTQSQDEARANNSGLEMRFALGHSPNKKRPRLSSSTSIRSSSVCSSDSDEYYNAREDLNTPRGSLLEQVNQMVANFQVESVGSRA